MNKKNTISLQQRTGNLYATNAIRKTEPATPSVEPTAVQVLKLRTPAIDDAAAVTSQPIKRQVMISTILIFR